MKKRERGTKRVLAEIQKGGKGAVQGTIVVGKGGGRKLGGGGGC